MKLICFLFALVVISEASVRNLNLTEGSLLQGATGVTINTKGEKTEIAWNEEFNATNFLKVYFNYVFEETGQQELIELDNLCNKFKEGSPEQTVQLYILQKLANTKQCPIKKGTKLTLALPIVNTYTTEKKDCGAATLMLNIFRNNPKNPKNTPLLITGMFRGTVTGADCKKDNK